ncbi:hypothetical protein HK096_000945, partial [Nowakowskiella sp. JEL0078]
MTQPLTKEQQQTALTEFRVAAGIAAKEASLSDEDLPLWGVDLNSALLSSDELSISQTVVLSKFLRAREYKVPEATNMLIDTLKWRKEFGMKTILDEKFPDLFADIGMIYGVDKKGEQYAQH